MELLATGRIRSPFGVEGFVKVESFSGEYEHFLNFDKIFLSIPEKKIEKGIKEGWFEVEKVTLRAADALLKLRGIDSPEAAKFLAGSELFIPRDKAAALKKGEVYVNDLCNCVLVCEGTRIGKITSVAEGGGGYLLEILKENFCENTGKTSEAAAGQVIYIPFNKEFIGNIDLKAGTVELMHRWILE